MPDIYTDRNGFNWFGGECLNPDSDRTEREPGINPPYMIIQYTSKNEKIVKEECCNIQSCLYNSGITDFKRNL